MKQLGVGIIGCGVISDIYMRNMPLFQGLRLVACADMRAESAQAKAATYSIEAMSVDALLARQDIDLIVNLTVPNAHFAISQAAISAGKHVFSEKPLCVTPQDSARLIAQAKAAKLTIGGAPDTFLGAGGRIARELVDSHAIGHIIAGSVFLMSRGPESWHPAPDFFYQPGGGPVLDMAPYYLAALVNLMGPIARVQARTTMGFTERIISAPGPRNGERIKVETPTTINAFVTSANGAEVSFNMSWDVWVHGHTPIELYGSEGSLKVPDPNFYDGLVQVTQKAGDWQTHDSATRLYGKPNFRSPAWPASRPDRANYRCVGIAEMASAIVRGTPHRSSADLASHTLAVMYAMLESGASAGKGIDIAQGFTQPAPLTEPEAAALWRDNA